MKLNDWTVQLGVGMATALLAWGAMANSVKDVKENVSTLLSWKDRAIEQMGNMDAKLDLLLQANGVQYKPKRH